MQIPVALAKEPHPAILSGFPVQTLSQNLPTCLLLTSRSDQQPVENVHLQIVK